MTQLTYSHDGFAGLIGVSRRDITPPIGIYNRNWGAAEHDVALGIHRPLTVTAIAIKQNASTQPLVLLSLDLGWWRTREDEWECRSAVLKALNVDESRVMLHFTHTHSGPSICREDSDRPGGHLINPYFDHVIAMCVESALEASAHAVPATLQWAYGKCTIAKNRDLPDPDKPRVICGFNPELPADDTLLIGRACDGHGKIIATLVNYALHPVTLAWDNTVISPDFVGAMREVIEGNTSNAPCLFLQGASGELAPAEEYTGDVSIADKNGRALGYAALGVLEGMLPAGKHLTYAGVVESGAPLATWAVQDAPLSSHLASLVIEQPLVLKDNLQSFDEIEAELKTATDTFMIERLRRRRRLRRIVGNDSTSTQRVWLWRLGSAVMVANANESYSALQIELRKLFPGKAIAVMNITNGGWGYLPERDMYDRDQYQVWQTPFERGCLEQTIESCAEAIEELLP
jgi:hypothetical protein